MGDKVKITWSAARNVATVDIYLAGKGAIASKVPNTGSYDWTIPGRIVGDGKTVWSSGWITLHGAYKITIYAGSSNASSKVFSILNCAAAKEIYSTDYNGGCSTK